MSGRKKKKKKSQNKSLTQIERMLIEFHQKALNLEDAIPAAHNVHHVDVCVPLIISANEH